MCRTYYQIVGRVVRIQHYHHTIDLLKSPRNDWTSMYSKHDDYFYRQKLARKSHLQGLVWEKLYAVPKEYQRSQRG